MGVRLMTELATIPLKSVLRMRLLGGESAPGQPHAS
jgi:hypothetical protein